MGLRARILESNRSRDSGRPPRSEARGGKHSGEDLCVRGKYGNLSHSRKLYCGTPPTLLPPSIGYTHSYTYYTQKWNIPDRYGKLPLHYASIHGNVEVITFLLAQGTLVDVQTPTGNTPLMFASRVGHTMAVHKLLGCAASVDIKNSKGGTALHLASYNVRASISFLFKYKPKRLERSTNDNRYNQKKQKNKKNERIIFSKKFFSFLNTQNHTNNRGIGK